MGKSKLLWTLNSEHAGHPHVGGEIISAGKDCFRFCGPSPRGWGNRSQSKSGLQEVRAIPTWVGKSARSDLFASILPGHPHVGGEIIHVGFFSLALEGPSPRGWGNQTRDSDTGGRWRAIPTWVGKSLMQRFRDAMTSGHPHVGGEITRMSANAPENCGPSPRGWGNRGEQRGRQRHTRAIPTWVGKSSRKQVGEFSSSGHPHVGGEIRIGYPSIKH